MTDLADKSFIEVYKELYSDFPNENLQLSTTERDQIRIDAYEEFNRFRLAKLGLH